MTRTDIINRARAIIAHELNVEPEAITLDACFIEDLGADSIDMVEITFALEEALDVEVTDEEAEGIRSLGQAVDFLCAKLGVAVEA